MKHPVDVHVGKRIRQRRYLLNESQQQLSNKVGVKFQQMQKYETGMNRVSASRLWDIAIALNVPVNFFFEGLIDQPSTNVKSCGPAVDIVSDRETIEFLRSYFRIPKNLRVRLFKLVIEMKVDDRKPTP